MSDDARVVQPYEPPSIEERAPIDVPLIGRSPAPTPSAVFRPASVKLYEPPRIEERTPVDVPLVQTASGPRSAVFRSA
jgi:hypothetical protein